MTDSIRVLVADDHPLFRQGVVHALGAEPGLNVVGEASSGEEALRLACELLPDVVLLDISMPGWGGLIAVEKITTACPATTIVMLTVSEDKDKLLAAFKAGARGLRAQRVWRRGSLPPRCDSALGRRGLCIAVAGLGDAGVAHAGKSAGSVAGIDRSGTRDFETDRHRALPTEKLGTRIFLSEKTIKHYVTNILQKVTSAQPGRGGITCGAAGRPGPAICSCHADGRRSTARELIECQIQDWRDFSAPLHGAVSGLFCTISGS